MLWYFDVATMIRDTTKITIPDENTLQVRNGDTLLVYKRDLSHWNIWVHVAVHVGEDSQRIYGCYFDDDEHKQSIVEFWRIVEQVFRKRRVETREGLYERARRQLTK